LVRILWQQTWQILILAFVAAWLLVPNVVASDLESDTVPATAAIDSRSARFRFRYHVTVTNLPPNRIADIWVPVATSDKHQSVMIENVALPGPYRETRDGRFGNAIFYFQVAADRDGQVPIAIDYNVQRLEVTPRSGESLTEADRRQFLRPNRMVPVGGRPVELLEDRNLSGESLEAVRKIYDVVDDHVSYDKPPGGAWGRGDAVWVCDSRYGNCSDFHSLFVSLCRSNGIPARFQIGFPVNLKQSGSVGGYHCWAQFADEGHWVSVDISEADKNPARKDYYFGSLPPDRVIFSTGRDLILEPKQASGPLNFFVYPHVEVAGKVYKEFRKDFSFELSR